MGDYIVNNAISKDVQREQSISVSANLKAPTTYTPHTFPYSISKCFDEVYVNHLTNLSIVSEPSSYEQAKVNNKWVKAMHQEIKALEENKTWTVTELPPGKIAIGCKWVFKLKRKPNGNIDRYKARLVAKGFHQIEGIDCTESFSPVAKLVTVRVLLTVATARKWSTHQIDINNAFLHGFLDEEVYMLPPQGYTGARPGQVCRLYRSLYGLKQAGRQWNVELCCKLEDFGFIQSTFDHCLFIKRSSTSFIILLVYVDDVLIIGDCEKEITKVKDYLDKDFSIKDIGYAHYFLRLEIVRGEDGTHVNQRKYTLDILTYAGLLGSKAVDTPLPKGLKLVASQNNQLVEPDKYWRLIGKLLYLNFTRLDISYAVQQLSQYVGSPYQQHWDAAIHVLRYLKGSPSKGLFFPANNSLQPTIYSDAGWASCPETRKSLTGFCVFLGTALISWRAKKQSTVARSSAKAEYRSMASAVSEMQWLTFLLEDLNVDYK